MKFLRSVVLWLFICGLGWLTLCGAIGIVAVEGALHPARLPLDQDDEARAQALATRDHATLADIAISGIDGAALRGWIIVPSKGNGSAVILLHGQADNRAGMLGPADLLLRHGFSVLLPDARAHGASGGPIATYGVRETDDLHRWANWLEQSEEPHCLFGLGDSMGAAELLESLSSIPDFCSVVAESSFASFREAAYDRIGQEFRTGPWLGRTLLRPAVEIGFLYGHWKYRIDLARASPKSAVAASRVPVLLIHGHADANLPPRHSEEIKAANSAVVLWEPRYAGHCGASTAEPEEYERRVIGWFESHEHR